MNTQIVARDKKRTRASSFWGTSCVWPSNCTTLQFQALRQPGWKSDHYPSRVRPPDSRLSRRAPFVRRHHPVGCRSVSHSNLARALWSRDIQKEEMRAPFSEVLWVCFSPVAERNLFTTSTHQMKAQNMKINYQNSSEFTRTMHWLAVTMLFI